MNGTMTIALLGALVLTPQDAPQDPFLEVSGTGEISVPADRARIAFAVETEGASAEEATERNAERMNGVLEAVREAGGPELRLETFGFQLQPRYRRTPDDRPADPEIVGYRALNHVRATVDDPEAVGRLLDAAVRGGANRVTSLHFEVADAAVARAQALREAVRRAQEEAEVMAEALGVVLGPPVDVRGGAERPGIRAFTPDFRVAAEAFQTPVEPGLQTVTATVTIRYRLHDPPPR